MDKSKTYIKMCARAEEIQDIVKPKSTFSGAFREGDYVASFGQVAMCSRNYDIQDNTYGIRVPNMKRDDFIWLPCQDQLQEMVNLPLLLLIKTFSKYAEDSIDPYFKEDALEFTSMEQLWLAFVMKERYLKIWNGSDWIKV